MTFFKLWWCDTALTCLKVVISQLALICVYSVYVHQRNMGLQIQVSHHKIQQFLLLNPNITGF